MFTQKTLELKTRGRATLELTSDVQRLVNASHVSVGLCSVFVHHTSASLMICENADTGVLRDLERYFARLVPDGDPLFEHTQEGPDDMPAHVRSVLTASSLTIPVSGGRLALGTWQGIFLWEHRTSPHTRKVTVTVIGPGA
jgi:secondary thiamine-phosphate synthase enzyme